MDYKLIATDMDGTLLDEEHGITRENVEAIVKVQRERVLNLCLQAVDLVMRCLSMQRSFRWMSMKVTCWHLTVAN